MAFFFWVPPVWSVASREAQSLVFCQLADHFSASWHSDAQFVHDYPAYPTKSFDSFHVSCLARIKQKMFCDCVNARNSVSMLRIPYRVQIRDQGQGNTQH
ncbi:hypothetical protein BDFG_06012 [Blastomyces dermatitidis ATCC 26199]|nr:hypothetical protein BDFG_06012 [Blastomyces dermatitidis ATCC 26199]